MHSDGQRVGVMRLSHYFRLQGQGLIVIFRQRILDGKILPFGWGYVQAILELWDEVVGSLADTDSDQSGSL